jgi:hypothetical protein
VEVAAYVEAVLQGGGDFLESSGGVGDAACVVAGGDAVLGDDQRDVVDDLGGVAQGVADRSGVVLPAGESASGVVGRGDRAVGADPGAGVGLDADPVVVSGGFDEDVFAGVAVGRGGGLGAGQGL